MDDKELLKPKCVGFIMDGNRRWAEAQNLHTLKGHQKGGEVFSDVIRWVRDAHIPHAVFYAFSTENWNRSQEEVTSLMKLALEYSKKLKQELVKETEGKVSKVGVRFKVIGDTSRLDNDLLDAIKDVEEESVKHVGTTIWVAFSYGGRAEIVSAVNNAVEAGERVDEESFRTLMWSNGMPDPDVIVRTGGQQRLSNFLTWQSAYSELVFLDTFWPEFKKEDFDRLLVDYDEHNRRFGK